MTAERAGSAIPPGLEAVRDFLNTADERRFTVRGIRHSGGDALAGPGDPSGWLAGHGMIPAGTRACPEELAAAKALRDALRDVLKLRARHQADDQTGGGAAGDTSSAAVARANAALGVFPLRVQVGSDGTPGLLPAGHGVRSALAVIAAATAAAEAAGTWKRLKICAAPDCRWVFYDTSRSGAGRWCSMRACGNRDKTRAYRQRHAKTSATPHDSGS